MISYGWIFHYTLGMVTYQCLCCCFVTSALFNHFFDLVLLLTIGLVDYKIDTLDLINSLSLQSPNLFDSMHPSYFTPSS